MDKLRLATIWLDGCSGCHMSFLDLDERLFGLADRVDLVYSPLVDAKEFPENVDIALVEGAIGTNEDFEKIRLVRSRTRVLVALGDCAVTANILAMRNPGSLDELLNSIYRERPLLNPQIPTEVVPALRKRVVPLHKVVKVDLYVPGCPPSADTIYLAISELLEQRIPDLTAISRFGA